jgi:ribosome maturation factor RimP
VTESEEEIGRIETLLEPVLAAHGLRLVDAEWRRHGRRGLLRVFVDKPGGVTIEDCRRFSGEAGDLLDVSGLIGESYDLEVSSPGLDRELRKDREFSWAVGKEMRCWLREPVEGRMEFMGRLVAAAPEALTVAISETETRVIPRRLVTRARLEPSLSAGRRA